MNSIVRIALAVVMILVAASSLASASGQVSANQQTTQPQEKSTTERTNSSGAVSPSGAQAPEATTYYAAPNGSSSGDGSISRPWDLRTALNQPSSLRPGDTILLRGGTYSGTFPSHLTGVLDENGVRYATYAYDTQGRAQSTEHANGVERYTLSFNGDGTTTVVTPLNETRTYLKITKRIIERYDSA